MARAASVSAQMRASAICPTAAAAWLSSSFRSPSGRPSTVRPSAIEPEETTSTSAPRAMQARDVLGERGQPFAPDVARSAIDEQRRADLDDDAAELIYARQRGLTGGRRLSWRPLDGAGRRLDFRVGGVDLLENRAQALRAH